MSIISGLLTSEYARSELVDMNGAPDPGSGHDTRFALDVLLTGAAFAIPASVMLVQVGDPGHAGPSRLFTFLPWQFSAPLTPPPLTHTTHTVPHTRTQPLPDF